VDKKTECELTQDLLLGYVDNLLNAESKKIVEKHLLECTQCQSKLNEKKSDIVKNESSQKKQIDYLKKIRRKNNIKAVLLAIGIIFFIFVIIYLRKFIIVNDYMNKAEKSLSSENFYIETTQLVSSDTVALTKEWYKDGKYKRETEFYSNEGGEKIPVEYATINTNEKIIIDHENKKVTIETGEFTELTNKDKFIKNTQFGQDFSLIHKITKAFISKIHTSYRDVGREYYVLNYIIDNDSNYEEWIDKETGLPLKISGNGTIKLFFEGTDIVKEEMDMCSRYKYEFGTVTEDDVNIPDYSTYEVEHKNTDYKEFQ